MAPVMAQVVAALIGVAISPIALAGWWVRKLHARQRNHDGQCATCGVAWREIGVQPTEYRLHGTGVCASCAHRYRRRTAWAIALLGGATALSTFIAFHNLPSYIAEPFHHPWWDLALTVLPPFVLGGATTLALRQMRHDNRAAALPDASGHEGHLSAADDIGFRVQSPTGTAFDARPVAE